MTAPPPTALTPEEQAFIVDFARETEGREWNERALALIRRLDADLVKMTQIATDAMTDANLSHEQIARLETQVGELASSLRVLRELMQGERLEVAVHQRDALARALEGAALFLRSVTHVHDHSGAMSATQLGRRDHFVRTVAAIDAALAQARQHEKEKG